MLDKPFGHRIDFVQEIISVDKKSKKVTIISEPDPRRCEWKEIKGKHCLYDKFDDVYFTEQEYFKMLKKIIGVSIYFHPHKIDDAEAYIKSRWTLIGHRIDFVQEIVSVDKKSKKVTIISEPDPRRCEWKEIKGKHCLYDKFDDVYFTEQEYFKMLKKIKGVSIYFHPHKIDDAEAYIKSRWTLIEDMLEGYRHLPTFEDKSEEFLQSLAMNKLAFVIISLDIVGSTKLATTTDPRIYARLISTVLYELSEIIPKFYGHVLKYTGDGLIAYFPEPSFIAKNDLAIDCALTLHGLVYKALNPILEKQGFPTIGIRIGLDSGEAYVETVGSPETKQHKDIIGAVVSLAAKIQTRAKPGEIYLGGATERHLHIMWRQICAPIDLEKDWTYRDSDGNVYKVYRLNPM